MIHNLLDALCRLLDRHAAQVQATARAISEQKAQNIAATTSPAPTVVVPAIEPAVFSSPARTRRLQRDQQVLELHQQGVSFRAIARRLGLHRSTVERFVRVGTFPERASRKYRRGTDAFLEFVQGRWQAGCRNVIQLTRELRERGFTGSYDSVWRLVAKWRVWKHSRADLLVVEDRPKTFAFRPPSSQQISFWILRRAKPLEPEEQIFLKTLSDQIPEVWSAVELSRDFQGLLRDRQFQRFESWLERASCSRVPRKFDVLPTAFATIWLPSVRP